MNRWLSIIVPTYNGAPYLSECLHSVLDQLPEDYELIVVGDGSKDDTKIILEGFAGRQSNLQVCFCSHKGVSFGEDRLFNFAYLTGCRRIMTSRQMLYTYIQRGTDSLSAGYIPNYFGKILSLHEAKTACFSSLSKGTTAKERRAFAAGDLASEVITAVRRFSEHPAEAEENLPRINALVFGTSPEGGPEKQLWEAGISEPGASERIANLVGLCMEEMVAYATALHADTGIHTQIMVSFAKDHTRFMMLDDGRCPALDELPDSPLRPSTITSSSSASPRPWNTGTSRT